MKYSMSANEKDLRAARQADRREKKSAALAEKEKKERSYRRKVIIILAVLVVLIIAALVINSNIFYTKTAALTVGDTKYSAAEINYLYRSTLNNVYQNIYNQLGDMTSMVLDINSPLSEQTYPYSDDESMTWADAIKETVRTNLVGVTAMYDAAVKEGYSLSDEGRASVDSTISQLRDMATSNGFNDFDKFLAAYYGKGMNLETLTSLLERTTIASTYSEMINSNLTYTDEQLAEVYSKHADELDYYDFYVYTLYASMEQFDEVPEEEKDAKVHEAAEKIIEATTDAESFIAAVKDFAGQSTVVNVTANQAEGLSINYAEWIKDPDRQPGDKTVIDVNGNSYALYFVGYDNNDYNTVDFRHILVMAEADDNGEYSDEALFAAQARAQELYAQWKEDPTEDNFISMAAEYSEDSASSVYGGLYEQVSKYSMVPGVNDFLFAPGRTAGDTDVVFGQSSGYAGYHVIYFVGENALKRNLLAEDIARTEDYDAKYQEIISGYEVVEGFGMHFCKVD